MIKSIRSGAPTDPHFGFYAYSGEGFSTRIYDIAIAKGWEGVYRAIAWKDLEPSKDSYDFSKIEEVLDYIRPHGLQFMLSLNVQGSKAEWSACPSYINSQEYGLCNNPKYGHWTRSNADRSLPITWNQSIIDRFTALGAALGAEYNGDPNFEGMDIWETSLGSPDPNDPDTCVYSDSNRRIGEEQILIGLKSGLPDKFVAYRINYCPWGCGLSLDFCMDNAIAVQNPDNWMQDPPATEVYPWMKDNRDNATTIGLLSSPSYKSYDEINGGKATPEKLLRYMWTDIDPWYVTVVGYDEPYFSQTGDELDSLFPNEPHPVLCSVDVVDLLKAEGWDPGHGSAPSPLPEVSVATAGSPINDDEGGSASFTLDCPDCSGESINFIIGGNAVDGTHYTIDKASPQPAGSVITVTPIDSSGSEQSVFVTLTIIGGVGYQIGNAVGSIEIITGPKPLPNGIKVTLGGHVTIDHTGSIIVT